MDLSQDTIAELPAPYWQEPGITIYCGDAAEIIPHLSDVQTVVTSPPYNQLGDLDGSRVSGLWAGKGNYERGVHTRHNTWAQKWEQHGYEDTRTEIEYQADQIRLANALAKVTTPTASLFYNHQCRWRNKTLLHPVQWFTPDGWNLRQEIIWARTGGMMLNARMFNRTDERILWFVKPHGWEWNQDSVGHGTVWKMNQTLNMNPSANTSHPVAFPIGLPQRAIAATTQPGQLILDPYMGSGTTLKAAKQLGRPAIGIDIKPEYCDIAIQQLAQQTLDLG